MVVLWIGLFVKEMSRADPSFYVTVMLGVLPMSLGMLVALMLPGLVLWSIARVFGFYRDPGQRRAMIVAGAVIGLMLMTVAHINDKP